jgi:hypothetical protein
MAKLGDVDDDRALLPRLIEVVGAERFAGARAAQLSAPTTTVCDEWFDVVWDIFDALCVPQVCDSVRVAAVAALYEQTPSYTVLWQGLLIHQRYEDLDRDARLDLWARLRPNLVSTDDRFAEPLLYALWEDFFDAPSEEEVWDAIVGTHWPLEESLLARILRRSGPVAPRFKYPLYERLLAEEPCRWDSLIYAGLMDAFDYSHGLRVDEARAESILDRLSLPNQDATVAYHARFDQERERRNS